MNTHPCKQIYDEISFIWCILYTYFIQGDLDNAIKNLSSMYEHDFDLTPGFEELLFKAWETQSRNDFINLAKVSLQQSLLNTANHVILVSFLLDAKGLSVNEASGLLRNRIYAGEELCDAITNVLFVAWLTNEDEKDGIMMPDEDDVLTDALKDVEKIVINP